MTPQEQRQAEIEAWMTTYRLAVAQARNAARELDRLGVKLSPPVIVKADNSRVLTKTKIVVTM